MIHAPQGKLDPLVSVKLPLVEAKKTLEMLVAGSVEGKIVLSTE